jgi:hypothetical protein
MKLSSEQTEFKDLLHRFFQEKVTSEYLKKRSEAGLRTDPALLKEINELGIAEGFSADQPIFSTQELGLLAHECGFFLVPEPITERILATALLPSLLPEPHKAGYQSLLGSDGTATVVFPGCCSLQVDKTSTRVSGKISWGLGVDDATVLVAAAETPAGRRFFACSLLEKGVSKTQSSSLDLTLALTSVNLGDVPAIIFDEATSTLIEDTLESIKASEAAGLCRRVVEMTSEYVKTRQQFGVAIGSFQAIQHKLADCYAKSESLHSLSSFATWAAVHSPDQRHLTARAAILDAAQTAPWVCETAIQAHGGIGFTWEYDLHLYLRRAKLIQSAFGLTESRARELISAVSA